jgi:hypothetical protein
MNVKSVTLGGFLGEEMSRWGAEEELVEVGKWWLAFQNCAQNMPWQHWHYHAAFATGFLWNFDDRAAYGRLLDSELVKGSTTLKSDQLLEFKNLQLQAYTKARHHALQIGLNWLD